MKFIVNFLIFLSAALVVASATGIDIPKLQFHDEQTRISNRHPESKVRISVGETPGFLYTVSGRTHSLEKIAVSGEYFNNENNGSGYAWLFLGIATDIAWYNFHYVSDNIMRVVVKNFLYEEFFYEINTPHYVPVQVLRISQINETAILVSGPSRSSPFRKSV